MEEPWHGVDLLRTLVLVSAEINLAELLRDLEDLHHVSGCAARLRSDIS